MAVVFCDAWGYWEEAVYWASHSDRLMRRRSHWQFCCVQWAWLVTSASVEEREEDSTTSAPSGTGNFNKETPCTSSGPPPPKKKRTNRVLDFLETETEKEEERFQATHELLQSTSNRFLDLFEQFIKKSWTQSLFVCLFVFTLIICVPLCALIDNLW